MTLERSRRKLAAILSADVKGYSRLMEQDEPGTVARIKEYRDLFSEIVRQYRGRVVDSPGDNILAEFTSVVDAVESALKIQKELKVRNAALAAEGRMEFRIGINAGDVIEDGERIYGEGVNIAARLESLAEAGGVCVSGAVFEQVRGKLPLAGHDLGEHRVRNISKPVRAYAIREASMTGAGRARFTLRKPARLWAVVAAAAVVVAVILWRGTATRPSDPASEGPSIAVLPFVDMSQEKDQEYFADGLAEELLNTLCRVPGLRVVGRTSSFQFKGKVEDLRVIGRKLNASTILEGSVRTESGRINVTAQLVNAADGYHIWSESYSYEASDIFGVQERIARAVTAALKWTLMDGASFSSQTTNGSAYHAYLLGRYYSSQRSEAGLLTGIDYLHQAVEFDPSYAVAWVSLAIARVRQADWGYISAEAGYREAREAVEKALALRPDLAIAHSTLGWMKMNYDWDWEGARLSFQRSIELEPGNTTVLANAAALFLILGRAEEGLATMRKSVQLDPLNTAGQLSLGTYAYCAGHLEEAAASLERALDLSPDWAGIRFTLGLTYLAQKRPEEALATIERETDQGWRLCGLALAYHALGREAQADSALTQLIAVYGGDSAYQIAEVYAQRGDADQAFEWLDRAYEQRDGGLPLLNVDPVMATLRGYPRYQALLTRMGLTTEESLGAMPIAPGK